MARLEPNNPLWFVPMLVHTFMQNQSASGKDLLRDPLWQFVGVLIALIALYISIWQARRRKRIAYRIVSNISVARIDRSTFYDGRLQILFDGQPLDDAQVLQVQVGNTGNQSIRAADYESPLSFSIDQSARILDAEIVDAKPSSLQPAITVYPTMVSIAPTLLNSGDSFTLKILTTSFEGTISASGRIVGVKEILRIDREREWFPFYAHRSAQRLYLNLALVIFLLLLFLVLALLQLPIGYPTVR